MKGRFTFNELLGVAVVVASLVVIFFLLFVRSGGTGNEGEAKDQSVIGKQRHRLDFSRGMPKALALRTGEWSAKDGRLTQSAVSEEMSLAVAHAGGKTNYRVEARVRLLEAGPGALAGIIARKQPGGSGYVLALHVRRDGRKTLQLRHEVAGQPDPCMNGATKNVVGGAYPQLSRTWSGDIAFVDDIALDRWHLLTLDVYGPHVVGYLDGRPLLNFSFGVGTGEPALYAGGDVGLCSRRARAQFDDVAVWDLTADSHMATPAHGRYDAQGRLLPHHSYAEYLDRMMDWQINFKGNMLLVPGHGTWKQGDETFEVTPHGFKDADGHVWPAYCFSYAARGDNTLVWEGGMMNFQGLTFFPLIDAHLAYYAYSGRPECLVLAREAGDWLLKTRRPADCALPLVPRTFSKQGGASAPWVSPYNAGWEDLAYGVPLLARAWLKLYAVTEDRKYLDAAVNVGELLRRVQLSQGGWRARTNVITGKPFDTTPTDWIFTGLALMEDLARYTGDPKWLKTRDRGLNFVLNGCLKTMTFHGSGHALDTPSDTHLLACMPFAEMLKYLAGHMPERPEYRNIVARLLELGEKNLLIIRDYQLFGGYGVQEWARPDYSWGFGAIFTMQFVGPYARIYELTRDVKYKYGAFAMFNTSTYFQYADGKQRQAANHFFNNPWSGGPTGVAPAIQFMSVFPETAPPRENHLLRWSSAIQSVYYQADRITYRTFDSGQEVFKVAAGKPHQVLADGRELLRMDKLGARGDGWAYDERRGVLRVRHSAPSVHIELR